jgi:hypothetical protein
MKQTWLVAGLIAVAGCARTDAQIAERQALPASPAAPIRDAAVAIAGTAPNAPTSAKPAPIAPEPAAAKVREVTLPAGTVLPIALSSPVGSDTSRVEDPVRATLRRAVISNGLEALPAGTVVLGHVTHAKRSAKVKGRASIGFRFTQIDMPGAGGRTAIKSSPISRSAPATKKKDAAKIGAGAAGGAIVGGILGGGDGAAKGAAIGGGAGTAVVLSTRGQEVRLGAGAPLAVRLTAPLTVRVPVK